MTCQPLLAVFAVLALSPVAQRVDATFDSNGVKIRFVSEGTGEPVVLIHGWMGDSTMWGRDGVGNTKLTAPEGFQVIALDCRGHGKSDKPHEVSKYGAEMADDVIRLLDHLKLKKAHIIGYSMGAYIAGKVAASHPERVHSVIYGGQAPLLKGESGSKEIDVFAKAVEEGKGIGPYLLFVRPSLTPQQADAIGSLMYAGKDLRAWSAAGRSFVGLEVDVEELVRSKAPTLFIYGSKESEATKTRVGALRKRILAAEEKVVEGGDHVTTLAKPEFGASIVAFLRAHRGALGTGLRQTRRNP